VTRKHFIAIAAELQRQRPANLPEYGAMSAWEQGAYDEWSTVVLGIASTLSDLAGYDLNGNRRFKRDRFLVACGMESAR
jgi:hypothetical protein